MRGGHQCRDETYAGGPWVEAGARSGYPWRYETWLSLNRKLGGAETNGHLRYDDAMLADRPKEFADITHHHYANVYDGTGDRAETFSGIVGLRLSR